MDSERAEAEIPSFIGEKMKEESFTTQPIKEAEVAMKYEPNDEVMAGSVFKEMKALNSDIDMLAGFLASLESILRPVLVDANKSMDEPIEETEPRTTLATMINSERIKVRFIAQEIKSIIERIDL